MITPDAEKLIKFFEAGSEPKLIAYKCPAGVLTIGWGHTSTVKAGQVIDTHTAQFLFTMDVQEAERKVMQNLSAKCLKSLTEAQYSTLVSLAFNLTTKSVKRLIEHLCTDVQVFRQKLLLYSKDVNGKELKGLIRRRRAELLLFDGMAWADILKLDKKDFRK